MIRPYSEVHDDVEATTNEIKKAANNARNKLKSQTASAFTLRLISSLTEHKISQDERKMLNA